MAKVKLYLIGNNEKVIRRLDRERTPILYAFAYDNWQRIMVNYSLKLKKKREKEIHPVINYYFDNKEWGMICRELNSTKNGVYDLSVETLGNVVIRLINDEKKAIEIRESSPVEHKINK